MTDRELLELAAKAAGLQLDNDTSTGGLLVKDGFLQWRPWNPLNDDGDALRLLGVIARKSAFRFSAGKTFHGSNILLDLETSSPKTVLGANVDGDDNEIAKTMRRMIVSVAAEIGKKT